MSSTNTESFQLSTNVGIITETPLPVLVGADNRICVLPLSFISLPSTSPNTTPLSSSKFNSNALAAVLGIKNPLNPRSSNVPPSSRTVRYIFRYPFNR